MIPLGVLAGSRYVAASGGAYYSEVMADSPIIYYRLNEASPPAVDTIGGTTASATAGVTFGSTGLGDGDTSADFTPGEFISVTQTAALNNLTNFTVEALVSVRGDAATLIFVSRDNASTQRSWLLYSFQQQLHFAKVVNGTVVLNSGLGLALGVTHHVAATYDGTTMRTYVNGRAGAMATTSGTLGAPDYNVEIGRRNDISMDGSLAGVAIYNSTLPASRVLAHAQAAGVI